MRTTYALFKPLILTYKENGVTKDSLIYGPEYDSLWKPDMTLQFDHNEDNHLVTQLLKLEGTEEQLAAFFGQPDRNGEPVAVELTYEEAQVWHDEREASRVAKAPAKIVDPVVVAELLADPTVQEAISKSTLSQESKDILNPALPKGITTTTARAFNG